MMLNLGLCSPFVYGMKLLLLGYSWPWSHLNISTAYDRDTENEANC